MWVTPDRYANYGEFCAARPLDSVLRQSDMGFGWRHSRDEPGHRLSWLPDTGELILVGPRPHGGREDESSVEVVAHGLLTEDDIRRALPRWAHAHNTYRDPLGWLRRRLVKSGFAYAADAPEA